jgi:hypothetical protein
VPKTPRANIWPDVHGEGAEPAESGPGIHEEGRSPV